MSKNTMEQQIAELTYEQRATVLSIGKKYRLSLLPVSILTIITLLISSYFGIEAKDTSESIKNYQILRDECIGNLMLTDYYEYCEIIDELFEKKETYVEFTYGTLIIGAVISAIYFIAVFLFFKSKYPYFTEGKYEYLKKLQKTQAHTYNQAQPQIQPTQYPYNPNQQYK